MTSDDNVAKLIAIVAFRANKALIAQLFGTLTSFLEFLSNVLYSIIDLHQEQRFV